MNVAPTRGGVTRECGGERGEGLDVAAAPVSFAETGHDDNDTQNNQDDPRDEKWPSAWQEKREQCRADERSRGQNEGFHQWQVVRRAM